LCQLTPLEPWHEAAGLIAHTEEFNVVVIMFDAPVQTTAVIPASILTPTPDVSVHVEQSQVIGLDHVR
jgi:hypothetical protein